MPRSSLLPARPGMDLKRNLLLRVTLFALLICVAASAMVFQQAAARIREHVARSGPTFEELIASEINQKNSAFDRSLTGLRLAMVDDLGRLLGLCIDLEDLYGNYARRRCFADPATPGPQAVRWLLVRWVGSSAGYKGLIGQTPGVKVGEFTLSPDFGAEAAIVWRHLQLVLAISAGVLMLNLLVYRPVRRALRPTDEILATLGRMEAGELGARMPRPTLIELRRIAEGFDHLAERLQETDRRQRQLAQRLLSVREQERRRLARELHDEFGQSLASIRVELSAAAADAQAGCPELLPPLQAIDRIAAAMLENLQRILMQLRPRAIEEFGLFAGIAQLVDAARRTDPACSISLHCVGELDGLPNDLAVSLYRLVQESLHNALRHGRPGSIAIALQRDADNFELTVDDDGSGGGNGNSGDSAGSGQGVLGMTERVAALGGTFSLAPREPHGTRVRAVIPATAAVMDGDDGFDPPAAGR